MKLVKHFGVGIAGVTLGLGIPLILTDHVPEAMQITYIGTGVFVALVIWLGFTDTFE